jgi:hypothetical protein
VIGDAWSEKKMFPLVILNSIISVINTNEFVISFVSILIVYKTKIVDKIWQHIKLKYHVKICKKNKDAYQIEVSELFKLSC